ncbi:dienelactone hydrolase family protein [Sinomicrobium weinanense]|uniref:Dienelactone hydrolase family protein n=1 Tax=Sinomicrobium weinanense TaxID=2842200 RepID=A0A926JP49_9FLAO|nr:prolyl oligopeptidase family serine peptidase [Sinomicrobium weinanense]MBC9794885.1 dienelactone hydrolase family protein [Sinomicrobium weinanense]MBU3125656.1 dienelactone hydrolase family protein [Sinomicrobium weinanense]
MKLRILIILILFLANLTLGQTSLKEIDLENGKYKVGFQHYTTSDSTRTYSRIFETVARPISVSIWYPSEQNAVNREPLAVLDYLEILKEEEEWEHLPNEQILNWFYYPNTPAKQKHLVEQTTAYAKAAFGKGKFPVIIYAPSFQASSIENFALCEYLASHGFVVVSGPSRGTETRRFGNNSAKEIETQARDVEFLMKEAGKIPVADYDKIAIMGFSFGGLSNIIVQNRNDNVKAIVSLDGTERYQYQLLNQSSFFDAQNIDVPYIHMAQKDIPDIVLKEDHINAELNTKFQLFDSLSKSRAYRLKFHNLTHSYFSTLGVLFENRDKRQDKSDPEIMESYKWVAMYTLNFLNATLHKDKNASKFIENNPHDNGITNSLVTLKTKQPEKEEYTFQDFNALASNRNYENLLQRYDSIAKIYPSFEIPEGHLNHLGLQLVFNPDTSMQGIHVFLLATKLYPNSANLYDSLGEGYLFMGYKEKAIESFKKSLELNSQNPNAINRLEELKK